MKRYLIFLLVLALLSSCKKEPSSSDQEWMLKTPLEMKDFTQLTSSQELTKYLKKACEQSNMITLETAGYSLEGKPIHLLKAGANGKMDEEKLTLYLFAQQHGDEPSGKEGMLLLINNIVNGKYKKWFEHINLLMIPQVNPDGGDLNQRRNANDKDLNRDHLLISAPETQVVHKVFHSYLPEVTVDIHEYDPYSRYWKDFGYLKDFDIQVGTLTNKNVDKQLKDLFYNATYPFLKEYVTKAGYSFFEYTLGDLPGGGRLRHSTVDINDGRQSFGILHSFSFIVEGKYGRDSLEKLENRAKSQLRTAEGIIQFAVDHHKKVQEKVKSARKKLLEAEQGEKVAIRMHHVKGDQILEYPLKSIHTGQDTVFLIEEFHSKVISILDVTKPYGYLVPTDDSLLVEWMNRSYIEYTPFQPDGNLEIQQYKILDISKQLDEGLENYYPEVKLTAFDKKVSGSDYYFVPVSQLRSNKIVTALEPQSMIGLVNTSPFEYLLTEHSHFPVLRVLQR